MDEDIKTRVEKYLKNAEKLFEGVRVREDVEVNADAVGRKILDSALNYYTDSKHFYDKGEYVNALAALEYAEGWLDAGKSVGVIAVRAESK
jgi:hypothetical protein